jgi:hypothetical protein
MKRLRRWLFNGLAAMSLFVFAFTAIFWVRSDLQRNPNAAEIFRLTGGPYGWDVMSTKRQLLLVRSLQLPQPTRPTTLPKGMVWVGVSNVTVHLQFPYWQLGIVFGILPVCWLINTVRVYGHRKRDVAGLCLICGYDLRATPERCPECGTVPPKTKLKA